MSNLLYRCLKCGAANVYENGIDGVLCKYCHGYLQLHRETEEECFEVNVRKLERNETPCIYSPIYCEDKDTGEIFLVTSIEFPLYSPSGKDLTIRTLDGYEWRSIIGVNLLEMSKKRKIDKQEENTNKDKNIIEINGENNAPKGPIGGISIDLPEGLMSVLENVTNIGININQPSIIKKVARELKKNMKRNNRSKGGE